MTSLISDFEVVNALSSNGILALFDTIDNVTSQRVVEFILAHNLASKPLSNLTLILNSTGGSLTDGFAIIDTIAHSSIPIHTLGLGQISSSALMIFMAGAKGHRTITPNTVIMSHQWSGEVSGKMHELVSVQRDFELTNHRVRRHYIRYSDLDEQQVDKLLLPQHDVYLTAEQAVEYGLADRIQT